MQDEMNPPHPQGRVERYMLKLDAWLWQHEVDRDSRYMRWAWHSCRVFFAVIRDLIAGHVTLHAMSLVYTTLLSLVPLLALSFSVLKGFGVHNQLEPMLQQFLAPLGDKGPEVISSILSFVDNIKVGVLGSVGLGLLIYTVISLVQKVERSFNEIWRVTQIRSLAQRFSNYLSVIMIGPLLAFAALGATATFVSSDAVKQLLEVEPLGWLFAMASRLTPYLMIIGLFTFVYIVIPNTKVRFKYAFLGGVVAGITWQTVGFAFTKFVAGSTNYAAIYSGFAVGIILLIWIYLAWLILLMGASVAFYAQHSHQITRSRLFRTSPVVDERSGLLLMFQVCQRYDQGLGGSSISSLESNLSVGPEVIQRTIDKLLKHQLLTVTGPDEDQLIPARSLDQIGLCELINILRSPDSPMPPSMVSEPAVNTVAELIANGYIGVCGDYTLADWIRGHFQAVEDTKRAASSRPLESA